MKCKGGAKKMRHDVRSMPGRLACLTRQNSFDSNVFRLCSEVSIPTRRADEGEAADQDVPCPGVVQRAADADEVFRLRRACVRRIVWVIHASASSKLEKRYTPRGARAAVPRSKAAVFARPA